MARSKTPPIRQTVTTEIGGKPYSGAYSVDGKIVVVSGGHGEKRTQFGGTPPDVLAKIMLGVGAAALR
jgi:hypothetical protein